MLEAIKIRKSAFASALPAAADDSSPHTAPPSNRTDFDASAAAGQRTHIKVSAIDVDQFALMPAAYRSRRL